MAAAPAVELDVLGAPAVLAAPGGKRGVREGPGATGVIGGDEVGEEGLGLGQVDRGGLGGEVREEGVLGQRARLGGAVVVGVEAGEGDLDVRGARIVGTVGGARVTEGIDERSAGAGVVTEHLGLLADLLAREDDFLDVGAEGAGEERRGGFAPLSARAPRQSASSARADERRLRAEPTERCIGPTVSVSTAIA